jgi:hypothetical protein
MTFTGTDYVYRHGGHATDVVGFAWNADDWCPRCVMEGIGMATTGPVRPGAVLESEIALWARENGVDSETTDAPQPIFNGEDACDENGRSRRCCKCHEQLIEQDEEVE